MNNVLINHKEIGYNAKTLEINLDKTVTDVVELLQDKNLHIATAESCTGGLIAELLTSVNDASKVFEYGLVTYSEQSKILLLDDENSSLSDIIRHYGVVSAQTAREMSLGLMRKFQADIYVSVTGCAGPSITFLPDGTPQKVGEVYIGITYFQNNLPVTLSRLLKLWEFPDINRKTVRYNTAKCIFTELRKLLEIYK